MLLKVCNTSIGVIKTKTNQVFSLNSYQTIGVAHNSIMSPTQVNRPRIKLKIWILRGVILTLSMLDGGGATESSCP